MIMSKKWLLGACGALLAGSLAASTAQASFLLDFQVTGIADTATPAAADFKVLTGVNPATNWNLIHNLTGTGVATAKFVPVLAANQTVKVSIFATVLGSNGYCYDDGLAYVVGNIVTNAQTGAGAGTGSFAVASTQKVNGGTTLIPGVSPFNEAPGQLGVSQVLGTDGGKGLGSLQPASASADFNVISAALPAGKVFTGAPVVDTIEDPDNPGSFIDVPRLDSHGNQVQTKPSGGIWVTANGTAITGADSGTDVPGGGIKVKIGEVWWTAATVGGGTSTINWEKWIDAQNPTGESFFKGADWIQDGQHVTPLPGSGIDYTVGAPVVLATVPEPGSLSLLALGALGLLARRRK